MDSYQPVVAAVYFTLLIVFGSFFCLNLTLAVIWDEFCKADAIREESEQREKMIRLEFGWEDTSEADAAREAEEKEQRRRYLALRKSYFWCGKVGSHEDSSVAIVRQCYKLVVHPWFDYTIMVIILINTAVLMMDSYPEDVVLMGVLEYINFTLTLIFVMEMLLKWVGLGLRDYVLDNFNNFDAFIVGISLLELWLTPPSFMATNTGSGGGALSALRTFRLFRLFKLARSWKTLQDLLVTMMKTLVDISNFAVRPPPCARRACVA